MSIYTRSNLYKLYTESDDEDTIQELFKEQFKEKCNLTESEVEYFLDNFTQIDYTENNINNYIHLVSFFDYDMRKDFLNHLIRKFKNIANSYAMEHFGDFDSLLQSEETELKNKQQNESKIEMCERFLTHHFVFFHFSYQILQLMHNQLIVLFTVRYITTERTLQCFTYGHFLCLKK